MKQKRDPEGRQRGQVRASSHPCTWVGRGAPSGLIKPFELDRRKQSEDSSIEPAGPSRSKSPIKSQETGPRPPPARPRTQPSFPQLVRGRPGPSGAHVTPLFGHMTSLFACGLRFDEHELGHRCAIAARAGPKPQAIKTRSDPQGPPYGGRPSHADRF